MPAKACAQVCEKCVGQQEGTPLNSNLVKAHRDTPSCSREEGSHVDRDHSQRGKLRVGKRRLESSRGQSAPVGKQDTKREGCRVGGMPTTHHQGILRYWARPFPWCIPERGCSPTAGNASRSRPRLDPESAS